MPEPTPDFTDTTDFDNASRGLIESLPECIIRSASGRSVWNNDEYAFLHTTPCPTDTANPKLWRQAQLTSIQGLFCVTAKVFQIRGFDLANMTLIEGDTGVIVVDPLTSSECASAGLALYRKHRGARPVTAVIYSHSHVDHFGGVRGVLPASTSSGVAIPILAPEGFLHEATSENIFVGTAMRRRAVYMYGNRLPKSPTGQLGCAIGMGVSSGETALVPPTDSITFTGETRVLDGVRLEFQMVPGTEAPAEFNFYIPGQRALYIAECATHCLHNVLTLRGALVRDARAWARGLDEAATAYGGRSDALLAGHNWPTWGTETIVQFIEQQRDMYGYLHDQTVRMMNLGLSGTEIAERMELPVGLRGAWHTQGFYGSVSHNVKGIYQRYMGWFDGDPAHLWEYPAGESAARYVECMGGVEEVERRAAEYECRGDLRFAATLLGHAVAVQPERESARVALAGVFEQLGFGAENATWRNFYLTGAMELRAKGRADSRAKVMQGFQATQTVEQWLAMLSVRVDGPSAACEAFVIDVQLQQESWRVILSNGVLTYRAGAGSGHGATLTIRLDKERLGELLNGQAWVEDGQWQGDLGVLVKLLALTGIQPHGQSHL